MKNAGISLGNDVTSVELSRGDCAMIFRANGEVEVAIHGEEEEAASDGGENLLICAAALNDPELRGRALKLIEEGIGAEGADD